MKLLVCGGRHFGEKKGERFFFTDMMAELIVGREITSIIQGGASGADDLARVFAKLMKIPCKTFHADWMREGHSAGPIRNQRMIDEGRPDIAACFPGGKGTANMTEKLLKARIETHIFRMPK